MLYIGFCGSMFHARVQLSKLSNAYFLDLSISLRALYSAGIERVKELAFLGVSVLWMSASFSDCPITWEVEEFLFWCCILFCWSNHFGSVFGILLYSMDGTFQYTGNQMKEDCLNRFCCFSRHICFSVCLFFAGCIIVIFCTLSEKRLSILVRAVGSSFTSVGGILKLLCGKQCLFSFAGNRASNVIAGNALL